MTVEFQQDQRVMYDHAGQWRPGTVIDPVAVNGSIRVEADFNHQTYDMDPESEVRPMGGR
jgi:hypothetical protein